MRRMMGVFLLGITVLIVSACGATDALPPVLMNNGDGQPSETSLTPEPEQPLPTQTDGSAPVAVIVVTRASQAESTPDVLADLIYGEMVASATEDPDRDLVFDRIEFTRYGTSVPRLEVVLNQDGTFTRDAVAGRVSSETVLFIDTMLDDMNFFGLQTVMMGLVAESQSARYTVRVVRNGIERAIDSEDGYMPVEYLALIGQLLSIGQ